MQIPFPKYDGGGAVVLFSGGMDSTTLLRHALEKHDKVVALSVHYGQTHSCELKVAAAIIEEFWFRVGFWETRPGWEPNTGLTPQHFLQHMTLDMAGFQGIFAGSSQTDPNIPVPSGHYEEESMKATVVPNRNMILLSLASAVAISWARNNADGDLNATPYTVYYGAHAGDHAVYPDCRKEFFDHLSQAIGMCHDPGVPVSAPFIESSKADICRHGSIILGENLSQTWSCYAGELDSHCGQCGTCVERREAFAISEIEDLTRYEYAPDVLGEDWLEHMEQMQDGTLPQNDEEG